MDSQGPATSLPPFLGDLNSLKERSKKAFEREELWRNLLTDVYDYFLPNRDLYQDKGEGQSRTDIIFDSTAPNALQIGASKLQENIAPIWSRWAIGTINEDLLLKAKKKQIDLKEIEIKERLEEQTNIVFGYINRSNFATQFYELAVDILIGTGTIQINEEPGDSIFSFQTLPQSGIGFEEGPNGTIETTWRKHKVKAANLERTWIGFKPSEKIIELIKKDPNCEIECTQGIVFNPQDMTYHGVVWCKDDKEISWYYNYQESNPIVTCRYSKVPGEVRGRGPALNVLADTKSLNKAKEFVLQKAAIDIAGLWTAADDGVMNPYTISISPGVVIPVMSNNNANPSLRRLETGGDINLALFEIEELKNSIKTALFNDLRDPEGPVKSATEIAISHRELVKRIGSAYGRIQTEGTMPILNRVMYLLIKRGKLDRFMINKEEVTIKYTSPMARAQDMEDILSAQQAVEFVLATGGEAAVMSGFKTEAFPEWVAKKTGMPSELVRSKEEREDFINKGAQAAMMQAAPQQQGAIA